MFISIKTVFLEFVLKCLPLPKISSWAHVNVVCHKMKVMEANLGKWLLFSLFWWNSCFVFCAWILKLSIEVYGIDIFPCVKGNIFSTWRSTVFGYSISWLKIYIFMIIFFYCRSVWFCSYSFFILLFH